MSNSGIIIVEVKDGNVLATTTGDLSHIETIGALTMVIHNMEYSAMDTSKYK